MVKNLLFPVILFVFLFTTISWAQELPPDEFQINFSGYFDSFDVNVLYPSISLTRKVSETTSITGRYLVDMITAASIRGSSGGGTPSEEDDDDFDKLAKTTGKKKVDAITAASVSAGGYSEDPAFDDVRQEFNLGITHLIGGNRISLNGIYSTERDYTSSTLAGTISRDFALKNTTVELGFVRSWDQVFPVTKDWTHNKNVVSYSLNFSQLISRYALIQFLTSYMENNGYLSDAYNQISIGPPDAPVLYDPIHPDNRIRRAVGTRLKFRLDPTSSMQIDYRYYWDSWEVSSHTISASYMTHLSPHVIFELGLRHYLQSRAYFFKPEYFQAEPLMTVDIKLDKSYSNDLQLELIIDGGRGQDYLPFLTSEKVQYILGLNIYQRQTETGYWYNGDTNLLATNFNIGLRYRF